jgi:hypothetical protein
MYIKERERDREREKEKKREREGLIASSSPPPAGSTLRESA